MSEQTTNMEAAAPRDSVAVVRGFYEAATRGDVPAALGLLHPEAESHQWGPLPWGGVYKGHEELVDLFGRLAEAMEARTEIERYIDDGAGHVVAVARTSGRAKATGREFDVREAHLLTVEDGKVTRLEVYVEAPKMREALGL